MICFNGANSDIYIAHWAKNRGHKNINSKIVEKGKIMKLLDGFHSPFMSQNHLKYFCYRFKRFSHEILRDF